MKYSSFYKRVTLAAVLSLVAQPLLMATDIPAQPVVPGGTENSLSSTAARLLMSPLNAALNQLCHESSFYLEQPVTCAYITLTASMLMYLGYKKFVKWICGYRRRGCDGR